MVNHKNKKLRRASILLGVFFSLTLSIFSSYSSNRILTTEATKSSYWSSFISSHTSELTKGGESLLNALNSKISSNFNSISYDGLWTAYKQTDIVPGTSSTIWDMYAGHPFTFSSGQCGNYSGVGSCYNREHSVPKSWFDKKTPMYSDIVHLVPTDGYVNNWRSNYAFGEVDNVDKSYSFPERSAGGEIYQTTGISKLGTGKAINGVSAPGKVFEPDDQYKGDFARIYMYFATRYNGVATSGNGSTTFKSTYPYFTSYGLALIKKWHEQDPVSQKEIDRNNAIEEVQGNRNPFVDYPEWANKIFGTNYQSVGLEKLIMNSNSEYLPFGSTIQLSVTPYPENASSSVTWKSSNENVATVDSNGLVTVQNVEDYALISATSTEDSSISAHCNIQSYKPIDITLESLSVSDISLEVGESKMLDKSYSPSNAYPIPTYSYEYDANYVSFDEDGRVSGKKAGSTIVTISAYQDGVKKLDTTCLITIAEKTAPDLDDSVSIKFKSAASDASSATSANYVISNLVEEDSKKYISSVTTATKIYAGTKGIKIGSSSNGGMLSLTLNEDIKNSLVSGIGLESTKYSSDNTTLDLYVNDNASISKSFTPGGEDNLWTASSSFSLSSLTIKTSTKRAYLSEIKIYFVNAGTYAAEDFATEFYNNINCDALGRNKPSFNDGKSWNDLKNLYESISSNEEKNKLINAQYEVYGFGSSTTVTPIGETSLNIARAMYRYDYIINKYNAHEVVYEAFIPRSTSTSKHNVTFLENYFFNELILSIVISLCGVALISSVLIISRHKRITKD